MQIRPCKRLSSRSRRCIPRIGDWQGISGIPFLHACLWPSEAGLCYARRRRLSDSVALRGAVRPVGRTDYGQDAA